MFVLEKDYSKEIRQTYDMSTNFCIRKVSCRLKAIDNMNRKDNTM